MALPAALLALQLGDAFAHVPPLRIDAPNGLVGVDGPVGAAGLDEQLGVALVQLRGGLAAGAAERLFDLVGGDVEVAARFEHVRDHLARVAVVRVPLLHLLQIDEGAVRVADLAGDAARVEELSRLLQDLQGLAVFSDFPVALQRVVVVVGGLVATRRLRDVARSAVGVARAIVVPGLLEELRGPLHVLARRAQLRGLLELARRLELAGGLVRGAELLVEAGPHEMRFVREAGSLQGVRRRAVIAAQVRLDGRGAVLEDQRVLVGELGEHVDRSPE